MYDLIIVGKELNKKKVVIITIILVLLIIIATITGINKAEKKRTEEYANILNKQQEILQENDRIKEEEKQAEINKKIEKINTPLTEEQKNNILNIYSNTEEKRVFLTFDDGPSALITPLILDILKSYNIKATFFLLGSNVEKNPDIVKREFKEGHYIANHGYSHKYKEIYLSPEATLYEYNITEQKIKDVLGNPLYSSKVFRFPGGSTGGKYNEIKQNAKAYLLANGVVHLDWNSLSEDAIGEKTKEQLLEKVKLTMGDKQSVVILMHDSTNKALTYEMLPELIEYLKEQGYNFKNIYDLL